MDNLEFYHTQQYRELNLDSKPIIWLFNNSKLRSILSNALNYEQVIPNEMGLNRDYRGLYELLNLPLKERRIADLSTDPIQAILGYLSSLHFTNKNQLNNNQNKIINQFYTIELLIKALEKIDRYDVIDDLLEELKINPINESEMIINGQMKYPCSLLPKNSEAELIKYDAYVSYVDEDLPFVKALCDYLESPKLNLRLFIKDRDLKMGQLEYAEFTELMEKQCKKLLVILSPDFIESLECQFQCKFTFSLQVEERGRKLIPIIYKKCDLPPFIKILSKIDLSRLTEPAFSWTMKKLISSLSNKVDQETLNKLPEFNFKCELSVNIQSLDSPNHTKVQNKAINSSNKLKNNLAIQDNLKQIKNEKINTSKNLSPINTIKLNKLDNNILNSKLNTTKSVLTTQTFNTDDTQVLIEKPKNFKLLTKIWKKINISSALNKS